MPDTDQAETEVYLAGDDIPLACTLNITQLMALIADIPADHLHATWLTLPLVEGGPALVRPSAIAALIPADDT